MTEDRHKYQLIVDELRQKIASGELAPGARLPSRPEIMRDYGVSNTVALRVGEVLKAEGLAEARSGSGTYVREHRELQRMVRSFTLRVGASPGSGSQADKERQGHQRQSYKSRTVIAPDYIRERLALGEAGLEEDAVRTDYVCVTDDEPTELRTSWEPLELTVGTPVVFPEDGPGADVMDRMRIIGIKVSGPVEAVRGRVGTVEECATLRLPPASFVLAIARTFYNEQGRPVETADIVVSAERYELVYGERVPE